MPSSEQDLILDVDALEISLRIQQENRKAVRDVSFSLNRSEIVCLVGESGCGKSVTALSIARLLPSPPARITYGKINFLGRDLVSASHQVMKSIRGKDIGFVFQDPMTSLNPVMSINAQLQEAVLIHDSVPDKELNQRVDAMLEEVGIPIKSQRKESYPHELSGGLRQRVMIAMALMNQPQLLIADEPTTALDVTIQSQILDLIHTLQEKHRMSILLITHDLGVVYSMADKVAVMYAGQIVEYGTRDHIFNDPQHPYTQALQKVLPGLHPIPGQVPSLANIPDYCGFYDRCERATPECKMTLPPLKVVSKNHYVRCIKV